MYNLKPFYENFLHFIWKFKLFNETDLYTTSGEKIDILSVGMANNSTGPDFVNARIKIADNEWVGNVEIHIKSSDWEKHGHQKDKAYNNVILHVVGFYERDMTTQNGLTIPTLVLKYNDFLFKNYQQLVGSLLILPCQDKINKIDDFYIRHFLNRILVERLERKSNDIIQSLGNSKNNWQEAFYHLLFRSFGFGVNSMPFNLLAKHTPLRVVEKYSSNVFQIEALLFGQAGFLDGEPLDDYQLKLKSEYDFLKVTYNLVAIDRSLWKFGRLRPSNFPTIRIAQLAKLISSLNDLIELIVSNNNIDELFSFFDLSVSKYWETHYKFGKQSLKIYKSLGKKSIEGLLINVVVPFMFTYGKAKLKTELQDKALLILEALPSESNSIVDTWSGFGFNTKNAFYSQAIIQLKQNYCDRKKCLSCGIGRKIIELS